MRLSTLLADIAVLDPSLDRDIQGLAQNSQQIQPGYLFLACRGRTFDGRQYIQDAIVNGASAVLADGERSGAIEYQAGIPIITIDQLGRHLHVLAAQFFKEPARQLQLIGVTGTNGKTSCSHFIAQSLQMLDPACAVIGTLGSGICGDLRETLMTTPDAVHLQRIFSEFRDLKVKYVAMEVSSHSLDQERIKGLVFDVGILTNLTQDHLDYHGDMKAYGEAKKRFFTEYPMRKAVINKDDALGQELMALLPQEKVVGYSANILSSSSDAPENLIYVRNPCFDLSGLRADVFTPWGEGKLRSSLIGEFNLSNVLAVLATLGVLGFPLDTILSCIALLKSVPGRMQAFGGGQKPLVLVDYAHTPDALEKALLALRRHCTGKLYCIFGCGGERDKSKRPLMGAIAERYADRVMLTNDNPRHERPEAILADILSGMKNPEKALVEANRSKAIQDVIQSAKPGDNVLVAGKGAESYQQVGDEKLPFSDSEKIITILGVG